MFNVAVVGYGHIGKRHCENIIKNPNMDLVAVCDPFVNPQDLPKEGIWWGDLNEMIGSYLNYESDHDIDLIIVATPNHLHFDMVKLCLEAGYPTLAEKPLALNTHEVDLLVQTAEDMKVPIYVNYPLRFLESVDYLKNNLKLIGEPRIIHFNVLWNRNENYYQSSDWKGMADLDGGPMFNEFIHHLNLLKYFFGNLNNIDGYTHDFAHDYTEVEDTGIMRFTTNGGGLGNFTYTVACPEKSFDVALTVVGDKGSFKMSELFLNRIRINDDEKNFEVNMNHFAEVLEAVRLKIVEGVEDSRLCTIYEAGSDVQTIQTFYHLANPSKKPKGKNQTIFLKETF